tara:strand:- start:352 stop:633 length:282 start_codon:yes stop_codon:yes gene_type:complete
MSNTTLLEDLKDLTDQFERQKIDKKQVMETMKNIVTYEDNIVRCSASASVFHGVVNVIYDEWDEGRQPKQEDLKELYEISKDYVKVYEEGESI